MDSNEMKNVKEINVRVYNETVTLTKETIIKTREEKIEIELGCINEVETGNVYLNPEYGFERYKTECLNNIEKIKLGEWDNSLSFIQTAYYIQTEISVPMLG